MKSAIPHFKRLLCPEKIPTNIISVESEVTSRISLYLHITEIRELQSILL